MATDFTQDSVLYFIRSNGGKVKNSELLFHFKAFVRDNENKTRYRELFKQFVNSVAVVKQEEGVSYVVLRKKFGGQARDISGSRPSTTPPGRKPEEPAGEKEPSLRAPETRNQEGTCRYLTKSHLLEEAPCDSNQNTEILPSCGILNDNNNEEKVVSFEQPIQSSSPCAREPERAPPEIPNADEPLPCGTTTSKGSTGNVETFEAARPKGPAATPPELNPKDIHTGGTLGRPKETNSQSNRPPPGSQHAQVSGVEENRFEPPGFEQEELPAHARGQRLGFGAVDDDVRRSVSPASSLTRLEPPSSSCTSDSRAASPPPRALPHPEPSCGDGGLAGNPALHTQNPEEGQRQRHSLPLEAEYYPPPTGRTTHPHPPPRQAGAGLSSSHGCLLLLSSADSPEWPPERGWSSEEEEEEEGEGPGYAGASGEQGWKVREALRRAQEARTLSQLHRAERKVATTTTPWHRSTGHLPDDDDERYRSAGRLDNQEPKSPWHRSAGHLRDDRDRDESTDSDPGSSSATAAAAKAKKASRPPVRRLHSKLRGRLCRSLGADLDRPPVAADDDPAAARRSRLKLLSSTLSIRYPSSAGSSPSGSLLDLSGPGGSPPSRGAAYSPPRQDHPTVPLEPAEHDWLVKGASASWTEIYSLFREEPSLLNRRDFVTGFTALHWIAKHGDHRVLNTLGYGVAKAGLRLDVDARTTCGYTPLHLAAIHGHKKMLRLLVYKFRADAALRDTSGKRAWQYLGRDAPKELLAMLGAPQGRRRGGGGGAADGGGAAVKPVGGGRDSSGGERSGGAGAGSAAGVKRSTSIAAFLKHHTLLRFPGHQSDSVV